MTGSETPARAVKEPRASAQRQDDSEQAACVPSLPPFVSLLDCYCYLYSVHSKWMA